MLRKAPLFFTVMALLLLLLGAQAVLPRREFSEMENRMLETAPGLTVQAFTSPGWSDRFEAFVSDQLPLRDAFVSLHVAMEAGTGRRLINGVLLGGGRMYDRSDSDSERNVLQNAAALREISETARTPAYLLLVPSAAAVYDEGIPANAPVADEEALLNIAAGETSLIPLLPALLEAAGQEEVFFRTDHHWSLAGVKAGYEAVCRALSLTPLPLPEASEPLRFFGSFYSRCPLPWQEPDAFSYAFPAGLRLIADGEEKAGLVDADRLAARDRYAALLYGNHGLMEFINDGVAEGALFVIKDSFANSLLPLLARHYHRVVAIDPRYFGGTVAEAVADCKGDAILCISGISFFSSSRVLALLD